MRDALASCYAKNAVTVTHLTQQVCGCVFTDVWDASVIQQAAVILAFLKEDKSPIYPDPLPLEPTSGEEETYGNAGASNPAHGYQESFQEPSGYFQEQSGLSHGHSESSFSPPESSYVSIEADSGQSESSFSPPESSYVSIGADSGHSESSYISPESYVSPESSYIPAESSYIPAESQYPSPEGSYPPPVFDFANSVFNRQKRALGAELDEVNELTRLLMSTVTQLDTDGCVLKLLCHLDTKGQEERTLQENVFFRLFTSSSNTLAAYNDAILAARGRESCDEVFPKCPLTVEELGRLLQQTSACSSSNSSPT
nr:uncharacterized protein LOC123772953 [Procambarus clarkii]